MSGFAGIASANRVVGMDRLIDVVWSDTPPPTAPAQIQKAISALRPLLTDPVDGADRISTRFPGYVLSARPGEVDVEVFHQEVRVASSTAARGNPAEAVTRFRAALARWFGRALDGVPGLATEATYLEEQRLLALENCIQIELALGRGTAVVVVVGPDNADAEKFVGELTPVATVIREPYDGPISTAFSAHAFPAIYLVSEGVVGAGSLSVAEFAEPVPA